MEMVQADVSPSSQMSQAAEGTVLLVFITKSGFDFYEVVIPYCIILPENSFALA